MNLARSLLITLIGGAAPLSAQMTAGYDARVFAGYFGQNTSAGQRGATATTWLMAHAQRAALRADLMLSADPLITGECGQPRLLPDSFHCGDAESLSHPLLMNAGVTARFGAFSVSASAVGEPAYGPHPHFMRASAQHDPGEPLTHHFFNPAHSAHGVVTIGATRGVLTAEASAFNGRHHTDRYRIDFAPLDAAAARFTLSASGKLSVQLSAAYFPAYESGEHAHGGVMAAYSATASGVAGNLAYTLGCAAHHTLHLTPKACLAEATMTRGVHILFARAEAIDRLEQTVVAVVEPDGSHSHISDNQMLKTGELAVGYGVRLPAQLGWHPSIGVRGALTTIPSYFRLRYREERAYSFTIFTSLRPARATSQHH
ncbi:MAG TPA: hypothetical protein VFZ04_12670 [Longimicrobiales bacterium]